MTRAITKASPQIEFPKIPKEVLEAHYAEYASQSDEWVNNMKATKRSIVEAVLKAAQFEITKIPVKVVVLGASDKRYIPIHHKIFEVVMQNKVEMQTFDIDTNHLGGESEEVITHDVIKPFPGGPYAIIFSHELMKFLNPNEQLQVIINSYEALGYKGLAMHIIHEPAIKGTSELRQWQFRVDPESLIKELKKEGIMAEEITIESESDVEWLKPTTVIILKKYD